MRGACTGASIRVQIKVRLTNGAWKVQYPHLDEEWQVRVEFALVSRAFDRLFYRHGKRRTVRDGIFNSEHALARHNMPHYRLVATAMEKKETEEPQHRQKKKDSVPHGMTVLRVLVVGDDEEIHKRTEVWHLTLSLSLASWIIQNLLRRAGGDELLRRVDANSFFPLQKTPAVRRKLRHMWALICRDLDWPIELI